MENSNFEKDLLKMLGYINLRLGEIRDQLAEMNCYILEDNDEDKDDDDD